MPLLVIVILYSCKIGKPVWHSCFSCKIDSVCMIIEVEFFFCYIPNT